MNRRREWLLNAGVALSLACATILTVSSIIRASAEPIPRARPPLATEVPDWREYGLIGRRVGPQSATVTIVEFVDYQCLFCRLQAHGLRSIRERYPNLIAVVYRHFPSTGHEFARRAAIAAECAGRDGAYESYHDLLLAQSDAIGELPFSAFAKQVGIVNIQRFDRCLEDPSVAAGLDRDKAAAEKAGIVFTPSLLINDLLVQGYVAEGELEAYVEAALATSKAISDF